MGKKNRFGGGNPNSLYTPMSEDEQEVLERLVVSRDLVVRIVDWGHIEGPRATFGDLRIAIPLSITFDRPAIPIPVSYFDLELRTGSGILLFKERQPTIWGGAPLQIGTGTHIDMVWDIAIKRMDPALVKALKPGAMGLTSRWTDRDTGLPSLFGNVKMSERDRDLLILLRKGEARVRARSKKKGGA